MLNTNKGDHKMAVYNKEGEMFDLKVKVAKDPNTDPVYSYKFPVLRGTQVKELWARKVRPIKDLTKYLQGCNLKRYKDYMVSYNAQSQNYEYWFKDAQYQMLFALAISGMKQSTKDKGYAFSITCPCCNTNIEKKDIKWDL